MKLSKLSFFFLPLALLAATGCSDKQNVNEQKVPSAKSSANSAQTKDILNYASMKDIRNINPHLYLGEMAAQAMVFDPLVQNTPEGTVVPALAQSWDISPDGKTYTFHLRKGVKYTDGTPFTAETVKQNFDAILANKQRHAWLDMINEIEKTEAKDDSTFVLHLKHPYFPTLIELGLARPFRFISPKCFKDGGTKDGVSCLSGTGPWVIEEHKNNQYAVFKPNPNYYGNKPKLKEVKWIVMPDPQTMLMALEKGEIDLVYGADGDQLTSDAVTKLQKEGKFVVSTSKPIASRAILLNSNAPITSDLNIREAIQRAVNKNNIVKGVLNNSEDIAETLFAKNVPGCNIDLKIRQYDPKAAGEILDKAGWKLGSNGVRQKDGHRLELNFYLNNNNAQEKTIAESIQNDLRKVGIKVNVIGEEKQAFLDRQKTGKFDLQYSLSWGAPYDPQSYLSSWRIPAHGDYQAQIGLKDKAIIDDKITKVMTEPDSVKRQELLTDILTRIHNSAVYLPVSYSKTKAIHSKSLHDVKFAASQYEIPFEQMTFDQSHKQP